MLYLRVTSLYLADSDHSEYLVSQLQDLVDVCSTSIPNITVPVQPTYNAAPPPTSVHFRNTTTTSAPVTPTTCNGQAISAPKNEQHMVERWMLIRQILAVMLCQQNMGSQRGICSRAVKVTLVRSLGPSASQKLAACFKSRREAPGKIFNNLYLQV